MRGIDTAFAGRMAILGSFLAVSTAIGLYLLSGTSVRVPILEPVNDSASVLMKDTDNLVPASDVRVAGVNVGEIETVTETPKGALVVFNVNDDIAPLREGLNVRVGTKSLIGESYLDLTNGKGAPYEPGAELPREVVQESVRLSNLYVSLDEETRAAAGELVGSLDAGTEGTKEDIAATMIGLGDLGREGHTALDAIAAQSSDLRELARQTTTLLQALDTGQGQIATMVSSADELTRATAGQRESIEATMQQLPGVLDSANTATADLNRLSGSLAPVAADLQEAAPFLNTALAELPATTQDLRGLLPAASGTLDKAPATLDRVPKFGADVRQIVPEAESMLRDINPMLTYIKPYGPELAAYLANFNASLQYTDEAGAHYIRLQPFFQEKVPQSPVDVDIRTYNNPFPAPGTGPNPGPFTGEYPRVERAPR